MDQALTELWLEVCVVNENYAPRVPRNRNSSPFTLSNPPRRFKDWFKDGLMHELIQDIDNPVLREWFALANMTVLAKEFCHGMIFVASKKQLDEFRRNNPGLNELMNLPRQKGPQNKKKN